jgi:NitT/TauT family transport system substrate-binding protein
MRIIQSRRDFLAGVSVASAAAAVLGGRRSLADEGPPEVTALRIGLDPNMCLAPDLIAEDLLRAEGFTDIRYVTPTQPSPVAAGEIDFDLESAAFLVSHIDAGEPITVLAGIHLGCYELFAHEPIHTISDLRGKTVGIQREGSSSHLLVSIMAAHIGLNPRTDINWITNPDFNFKELFAEGKVDAFLGAPPKSQELRARKIGRVILDSATDRPWSDYFCCLAYGNRNFVRNYPTATKRYLRAVLKATDICANEPKRAAQRLVDGRFADRYEYALQTLTELTYDKWREFDSEDALRFYALQLHEVDMVKSTPTQIIADGTDWRFLNELKRELKA